MIDPRFYDRKGPFTIQEIARISGAELTNQDEAAKIIKDVASLELATAEDIACLHNPKYIPQLLQTKAAACFITPEQVSQVPPSVTALVTKSPYRAYGLIAQSFYPNVDRVFESSDTAIHPTASIAEGCIIEYGAVIHAHVQIGKGTRIGANCVISRGVIIGEECIIEPGVTISHSIIGNKVMIFAGARLGQAGFGFFMDEKSHVKVPQLGRVIVGDDVEIGANTTIDRGSLQDTFIGSGCRLDNLVQIAHNVRLGKGCVIVSQVGIAGSTHLGNYVIAAGQVGIAGHLKIGNFVKIAAQSGVMRDIADGETVAGSPAMPVKQWHRQTVMLQKLVKRKEL
jgi:UDP-3-O-[3-hydroxymyristoyl] glucosamine N-acyltransferase